MQLKAAISDISVLNDELNEYPSTLFDQAEDTPTLVERNVGSCTDGARAANAA